MRFGIVGTNLRVWFAVEDASGVPKTGLVPADFTVTVAAPDDSASTSPAVAESTQSAGMYYFDAPGAFFTAHGVGPYGVHIVASVMAPPFSATRGDSIKVTQTDIDAFTLLSSSLDGGYTVEDVMNAIRKVATNRIEESPGNPGTLIVYDDDGVTPLLSFQVRDYLGNAVTAQPNVPARRSAAT